MHLWVDTHISFNWTFVKWSVHTAHAPRSLEENVSWVRVKWSNVIYTPKSQMMTMGGGRLCLWMPHFAKCQPYSSLKNFSWNFTDPWNALIWAPLSHIEWGKGGLSCILCSCCCLGDIWWSYTRSAITSSGLVVNTFSAWTPHREGLLLWKGLPVPPSSPQQPEHVDDNRDHRQSSTCKLQGNLPDEASDKSYF